MSLHLALHEPEIPQNTGNIARTCAAVGAVLHLIHPLGFSLADRYLKRAGLDYWKDLTLAEHPNLDDFLDGCRREGGDLYLITKKASRDYSQADLAPGGKPLFLLFGKESAGLPEELLRSRPQDCLRLPMQPGARSLNLSNTAAILAYEALRQQGFPHLSRPYPGN